MATTSRWSLRYPVGTDPADAAAAFSNLASDCDSFAKDDSGTLASRPTATDGLRGFYYYATDSKILFRCMGASLGWLVVQYFTATPRARVSRGLGVFADSTTLTVPFTSEDEDTDGMVDISGAPTKVTIATAGIYGLSALGQWAPAQSGRRINQIVLNGSTVLASSEVPVYTTDPTATVDHCLAVAYRGLAVNDYLTVVVYQSSGGSLEWQGSLSAVLLARL